MSMGGMMYQAAAEYNADSRMKETEKNQNVEAAAIRDYVELSERFMSVQSTELEEEILTKRLLEYEEQIRQTRNYMDVVKLELFDIKRLNYLKTLIKEK